MEEKASPTGVAEDINRTNPQRKPVLHTTVGRFLAKFIATGSVDDAQRSGSPKKLIRHSRLETGVPRSPVQSIQYFSKEQIPSV